jgi:hypothetical protein
MFHFFIINYSALDCDVQNVQCKFLPKAKYEKCIKKKGKNSFLFYKFFVSIIILERNYRYLAELISQGKPHVEL